MQESLLRGTLVPIAMTNTNVEVKRGSNEATGSVLRRFTKRVQEAGILPRVRGNRYSDRSLSALKVKRAKLKKLARASQYEKLRKLGKAPKGRKGRKGR